MGSDTLIAGTDSYNTFLYSMSEFATTYWSNVNEQGDETIRDWGGAAGNTLRFDDLTLSAVAADNGLDVRNNGNWPATVKIDEHGLATITPAYASSLEDRNADFYMIDYVIEAVGQSAAGTSAVFNRGDDAYLVVMTGVFDQVAVIKLIGVHSEGLVFDQGAIASASFIGNH